MGAQENTVQAELEQMALKIVLVEPGDLATVGELLEHLERLLTSPEIGSRSRLRSMGAVLWQVLDQIILTTLDDSAENYAHVGEAIGVMQEAARRGEDADDRQVAAFCEALRKTGFAVPDAEVAAGTVPMPKNVGAEEGGEAYQEEAAADGQEASSPPAPAPPEQGTDPGQAPAADAVPASGSPGGEEDGPIVQDPREFMQDMDLLSGFVEEAMEHLETIEVNVLELENSPGDPEIINNIFRPFHTIKGVSGFLNLKAINKLAHATENLLDDVRNGVRAMDSDVIDVVLSVGDYLKAMIDNLRDVIAQGPEAYKDFDIREYTRRIREIREGKATAPPEGEQAPAGPAASAPAPPAPPAAGPQEAPGKPVSGKPASGQQAPGRPAAPPAATRKPVSGKKVDASIKVNIEKLDALVNAVGELVIMQSLVQENPHIRAIVDPKLTRDFSQLARITSELQKTAMSMRMVPIRQTFQKMIRLVRDLSKKSGKIVNLVMEGEDTEIDRNMVDSIYDPLVHMIRNSVDHGVQPPEERQRLGKPPAGTVALRAYQKGGNMVIEIEDDGNGLNTEKIRQKAIERGLIQPDDNLSAHELNNLIFVPGFSTADKITDVSGRGVGMDVVKKAVEKLRGKVEVYSEPGKGSLFVIKLPLTLAIIDGIVVRVGSERYIIPTIAIKESLKPTREQYQTVCERGEAILLRDHLVPVLRLYQVFDIEPSCTDPCEAILVVVEHEGQQRALMVDELLGKQEVVIKSLGGLLTEIPGVAGGTILGDGRVGLILDLAGLFAASGSRAGGGAGEQGEQVEAEGGIF